MPTHTARSAKTGKLVTSSVAKSARAEKFIDPSIVRSRKAGEGKVSETGGLAAAVGWAGKFKTVSSKRAYRELYKAPALDRIHLIVNGVWAVDAKEWLEIPPLGRNFTLKALGVPVATFNKKVKAKAKLSSAESERVVGFARLVGQVETLVKEAEGPADFNAGEWLGRWLIEPLPALGGTKPIDLMNTMEGQNLVSQSLSKIVSGAYA